MAKVTKYIRRKMSALRYLLARRVNLFSFLHGILPSVFSRDINYLPLLKKLPLFLLIALVIISFIVTSMPHIFLAPTPTG